MELLPFGHYFVTVLLDRIHGMNQWSPMSGAEQETDSDTIGTADRIVHALPLGLLVVLAFILGCFEITDYDLWWHLRAGQLIRQSGSVPHTDLFSFTSPDNLWIDVHWCFQVLLSWIFDRYGSAGLVVWKATLGATVTLIGLTAYRSEGSRTVQVLVWLPAILLMSSRFFERPEMLTLIFTALFLSVLFHAERSPVLLWILPPAQVAWANCQGLFIFGPIFLGMYWLDALARVNRLRGMFRHLTPVTILVIAACFVSPYREQNVLLVVELFRKMRTSGQIYRDNIAELQDISTFWSRGGFLNPYLWLLLFLLGLSVISVVVAWRSVFIERRLFRALPLLAFGWLGLQATRNGNHFALVAAVIVSWNLGLREPQQDTLWRGGRRFSASLLSIVLLCVMYLVVTERWHDLLGGHRRLGFGERVGQFSHEAIRLAGSPGMPDRAVLFHLGHAADYIYRNGPDRKVYMDGRLEVHSEQLFRQYLALENQIRSGNGWDGAIQSLGSPVLVIDGEHNSALQAEVMAHPSWECLHLDEVLGVFTRRSSRRADTPPPFRFESKLNSEFPRPLQPRPLPQSSMFYIGRPPAIAFRDRDDYLAARGYFLSLTLHSKTHTDPWQWRALTWWCVQAAERAVHRRPWESEGWRHLGGLYLLLGQDADAGEPAPTVRGRTWDACQDLLSAIGMAALRAAVVCNPNDATATFLLQERWGRLGAADWQQVILRKMQQRLATNLAQMSIWKTIPDQLSAIDRKLSVGREAAAERAQKLIAPTLADHIAWGTLGTLLDETKGHPLSVSSAEEIERLGGALLAAGLADDAQRIFEEAVDLPGRPISRPRLIVRLACCEQAAGRHDRAASRYQEALALTPELPEALYGLATISLQAGDTDSARRLTKQALSQPDLSPAHRRAFDHLLRLLTEE